MKLIATKPSPQQELALNEYLDLLWQWNASMNLTGAKSREELALLARESFFLASFLNMVFPESADNFTMWDFGAGAGLPGIPLRIVYEQGHYTMVEARQKRALFLANVMARLKLPRTHIAQTRAEDFMAPNARADCIASRAFMPWQELLPFCKPALSPHSRLIIMANEAPPDLPPGWQIVQAVAYSPHPAITRWFWAIGVQDQPNVCA